MPCVLNIASDSRQKHIVYIQTKAYSIIKCPIFFGTINFAFSVFIIVMLTIPSLTITIWILLVITFSLCPSNFDACYIDCTTGSHDLLNFPNQLSSLNESISVISSDSSLLLYTSYVDPPFQIAVASCYVCLFCSVAPMHMVFIHICIARFVFPFITLFMISI